MLNKMNLNRYTLNQCIYNFHSKVKIIREINKTFKKMKGI